MKTITDFETFYAARGEFTNLELTLDRIKNAAEEAGIHDNIAKNTIHIAGTNGKGSTAFFIEQILAHRGLTTACFTSPHITNITERIRVNGSEISADDFNRLFHELKHLMVKHDLSYFEGLTLMAFKHFQRAMPDAAIIETGLGGRLDSTNILNRKIPVITTLSKDHTEYLGSDVFQIADEKLAIVKNNLLIFAGDNDEHMNTYINRCLHTKTVVRGKYSKEPYRGFEPPFSNNLKLAEEVCNYIAPGDTPDNLKLPPCRFERIGRFILDGGHNKDAVTKLAERFAGKKPTVIFTATKERDLSDLLDTIKSFAGEIILTAIPGSDRSIDINTINMNTLKEAEPASAVKIAVELNENADILVCGSLYLCAYVREILTKGKL